jgi:hypothetical protein
VHATQFCTDSRTAFAGIDGDAAMCNGSTQQQREKYGQRKKHRDRDGEGDGEIGVQRVDGATVSARE